MKTEGFHKGGKRDRQRPNPEAGEIADCIEAICDSFRCLNQGKRRDGRPVGRERVASDGSTGEADRGRGPVWGEKQDVYAVGVIIRGLLANQGSRDGAGFPKGWRKLADQCLADDPGDRPGFDELIDAMDEERETTPAPKRSQTRLLRFFPILVGAALIFLSAKALSDLFPGWTNRLIETGQALVMVEETEEPGAESGEVGPIGPALPRSALESAPIVSYHGPSTVPLIGQGLGQSMEWAALLHSMIDSSDRKEIRLPDFGAEDNLNYASLFPPEAELELPEIPEADRVYWLTPEKAAEAEERSFLLDVIGMEMIWIADLSCWVARTEVTHDQIVTILGDSPSRYQSPGRACDSVSWDQAMAFCRILTEMEGTRGTLPAGYVYTLPTEEQWNVYVGDAGRKHSIYGRGRSHGPMAPGTRPPNFWGLVDVRGNLWEWMRDDHTPGNPLKGKALRGGAFVTSGEMLMDRNARFYGARDVNYFQYGFRPVLALQTGD